MKKDKDLKFPKNLLEPIEVFLEERLRSLKRTKRTLKTADPFLNETRTLENSVEEDVDEQLDHLSVQTQANFVSKQIVQLRKALTRMKIGKFGICESCGKMIDTDRLAVNPEATKCIKCAKESE